jgi:hypothetical protein
MKDIALITSRDSEKLFFALMAKNSQVPVKQLCRKISRKMLYKYLKQLQQVQEATGRDIFTRRASICPVTGLPNIVLELNCRVSLEDLPDGAALITLLF